MKEEGLVTAERIVKVLESVEEGEKSKFVPSFRWKGPGQTLWTQR